MTAALEFELPEALVATAPPEARGEGRDDVRLLVFQATSGELSHTHFPHIGDYLRPGDALVINVSKTMPYALEAQTPSGSSLRLHLSVAHADGLWSVEVRTPKGMGSVPGPKLEPQTLALADGGAANLLARDLRSSRLWRANLHLPVPLAEFLSQHGQPIRYHDRAWPLTDYQTVYAREPGSAEMPSAGRPFTRQLLVALAASGVSLVPIVLHSGVSSFESDEVPGEERYSIAPSSAAVINALRSGGGRVIAVGTTTLRALETAAGGDGSIRASHGYTDLVIGPHREVRAIDGLLTGWHEPGASHLAIIESVAGTEGARRMYAEALEAGYLWHEFGDSSLILR
jgi:S-adenosylmethionine:tRNA ribosyltransferase-isomerase